MTTSPSTVPGRRREPGQSIPLPMDFRNYDEREEAQQATELLRAANRIVGLTDISAPTLLRIREGLVKL